MLGAVGTQPFQPENHFIVVGHAHPFRNLLLQVTVHGAVESGEPVYLVGEDTGQREHHQQGNVFQGQFHTVVFYESTMQR